MPAAIPTPPVPRHRPSTRPSSPRHFGSIRPSTAPHPRRFHPSRIVAVPAAATSTLRDTTETLTRHPHSRTADRTRRPPRPATRNTNRQEHSRNTIHTTQQRPQAGSRVTGHTLTPASSPVYSADISQTPARSDLHAASPFSLDVPQSWWSENATRSWTRHPP